MNYYVAREETGGYFVDAILTYVGVLNPEVSLMGSDDPPHAYYARKAVSELGLLSVSEMIADVLFGTNYSNE